MKSKHLKSADRSHIELGLNNNLSCEQIAKDLGKHRTTISKEILKHRELHLRAQFQRGNRNLCKHKKMCGDYKGMETECNTTCNQFELASCPRLRRFPYVCNGCNLVKGCQVLTHRYFYNSISAYNAYIMTLHESRKGIILTEQELDKFNEVFNPHILKRQSVKHILACNPQIKLSHQTIYNYINAGILEAKRIDLTRAVKFKTKKEENGIKSRMLTKNPDWLVGRTYNDFIEYTKNNNSVIWEMDTVVGKQKESDCFLTLLHRETSLLLIIKMKVKTQWAVKKKLDKFCKHVFDYESLGEDTDLVLLTDRGSEFLDPEFMETNQDTGEKMFSLFYCDPMCSHQKGKVENAHTLIRRFIPKGTSLTDITQEDCIKMMNNINSFKRERLDWISPHESFRSLYNTFLLHKYRLRSLSTKDVTLDKSIFK